MHSPQPARRRGRTPIRCARRRTSQDNLRDTCGQGSRVWFRVQIVRTQGLREQRSVYNQGRQDSNNYEQLWGGFRGNVNWNATIAQSRLQATLVYRQASANRQSFQNERTPLEVKG